MSYLANSNRAILTGVGAIVPEGSFFSKGIDSGLQVTYPFQYGLIQQDLSRHIGAKGFRFHDRSSKLNLIASKNCLQSSQLLERYPSDSINVIVGSDGALQSQMNIVLEAVETPQFMNPQSYPNRGCNVIAGQVSLMFGLRGESTVVSSGYRSGLDAFIYAIRKVENGSQPYLVVAGESLSTARNVQTFSQNSQNRERITEGAIALTIEKEQPCANQNGQPICKIIKYKQFSCAEESDWKKLAEDFIAPFNLYLNRLDYVYGRDEYLEIQMNEHIITNPYDLFGGTVLLGFCNVILHESSRFRHTLLISSDKENNYGMILLKRARICILI